MPDILVLYYSRNGSVAQLARQVARGIGEVPGMNARLRTVPPVAPVTRVAEPPVPGSGAPYVERADLEECAGLLLGSPTRFGNMAAPLKHFLDGLGAEWASGTLVGKPAGVFTSTASMHGGQESTLLSMMPLLLRLRGRRHPFTEPRLSSTRGGTPYGASHVAGPGDDPEPSEDEAVLARALGRRIAGLAAGWADAEGPHRTTLVALLARAAVPYRLAPATGTSWPRCWCSCCRSPCCWPRSPRAAPGPPSGPACWACCCSATR